MDDHVAWAQLGAGLVVPGGAWGGVGVGSLILHRFGMPTKDIAERQFNLSFLNTAVDALALVIFGVGLATGIFTGAVTASTKSRYMFSMSLALCVISVGTK